MCSQHRNRESVLVACINLAGKKEIALICPLFENNGPVGYVPFLAMGPVRLHFSLPKHEFRLVTIGDHIRKRRRELGLTQCAAAARIGVCRDALAQWEVRPKVPDVSLMPAIINFLSYNPLPKPNSFRELLCYARRTLGLKQQDMAALLSVPIGTFNAWEQDKYLPSLRRRSSVEAKTREYVRRAAAGCGEE